jgi:hypothetical protein
MINIAVFPITIARRTAFRALNILLLACQPRDCDLSISNSETHKKILLA